MGLSKPQDSSFVGKDLKVQSYITNNPFLDLMPMLSVEKADNTWSLAVIIGV